MNDLDINPIIIQEVIDMFSWLWTLLIGIWPDPM